jgi:hypothetical protein
MAAPNTFRGGPDERGLYGIYGGRFVAETLMPLVLEVERAYEAARKDPGFKAELGYYLEHYVGRNHTTGSAWPLTNNPKAKYNDPKHPDCNLNIPLWRVVRASTAAPVYFEPEEIMLGNHKYIFVDGSITPYNNPALIAALTAVLPPYNLGWEPGPDKVRLISIGTIRVTSAAFRTTARQMWLGYHLPRIPAALIQGIALQQDYLCRCLGDCIFGEELDQEVRDLIGLELPGRKWFSYVRYNHSFLGKEAEAMLAKSANVAKLDAVEAIPVLREMGREYAKKILIEHLI